MWNAMSYQPRSQGFSLEGRNEVDVVRDGLRFCYYYAHACHVRLLCCISLTSSIPRDTTDAISLESHFWNLTSLSPHPPAPLRYFVKKKN